MVFRSHRKHFEISCSEELLINHDAAYSSDSRDSALGTGERAREGDVKGIQ